MVQNVMPGWDGRNIDAADVSFNTLVFRLRHLLPPCRTVASKCLKHDKHSNAMILELLLYLTLVLDFPAKET